MLALVFIVVKYKNSQNWALTQKGKAAKQAFQ